MVDNYEFWDPEKETHKEFKMRTKGKGMRGGVGKKKNADKPEGGLTKLEVLLCKELDLNVNGLTVMKLDG